MHNHNAVYVWTICCIQTGCKVWKNSTEEKLNHLEQIKQWLVKRGYREDHVYSEIERMKLVERAASFQIRDKKVDDSIILGLTYHPTLYQLYPANPSKSP